MAKRINANTGYPMSTDKQIKNAKYIYTLSESQGGMLATMEELIKSGGTVPKTDIFPCLLRKLRNGPPEKADYYYKLGEWDKSEKEYLQCFYTNILAADKLRILYQKEKRFKDAYFIMKNAFTAYEELGKFGLLYTDFVNKKIKNNIEKAEAKAKKYIKLDKSLLNSQDQLIISKQVSNYIEQAQNLWDSL